MCSSDLTFFAYDEVAHHTGIDGGAAHRILRRLDGLVHRIECATGEASRPYRIIILSDHGQSEGATFLQRQGRTLETLVSELGGRSVAGVAASDEGADRLTVALSETAQGRGATAKAAGAIARRRHEDEPTGAAPFVVLASGCLGLVYVTGSEKRLTRERLEAAFPGLVDGLAAIPDVGFVFVATERAGSVAISARGENYVADERVVGDDPLADYPNALRHLRRTDRFANVPDILCNGRFDPVLGDVPAFEELVGSHGGLGGTQAVPFVLSPVELPLPTGLVVGAETLHRLLRSWVEEAMPAARSSHAAAAVGGSVAVRP